MSDETRINTYDEPRATMRGSAERIVSSNEDGTVTCLQPSEIDRVRQARLTRFRQHLEKTGALDELERLSREVPDVETLRPAEALYEGTAYGDGDEVKGSEAQPPLADRGLFETVANRLVWQDAITRWESAVSVQSRRGAKVEIARRKAIGVLDNWALLLPERVNREILGDYVEDINLRGDAGESRWRIYVRMVAAILYTAANTVAHVRSEVGKKKA